MEKKKKLLFVYYKLWKPGGIARVLTNLVNELVKDHDVTILVLLKDTTSFYNLDKRVKVIGLDTYQHWAFTVGCVGINKYGKRLPKKQNIKNYLYDFGASRILKQWLNENHQDYDVLIPCQYKLSIQLASHSKLSHKTIAWEHTDHEVGGKFFNRLRNKNYKKLKAIIAINTASEKYYQNLNHNSYLIPNIIGEPFESLAFSQDKENIISFVGRLDREKNVIALLEIIKESDLNSIWKFQIIGDGPERKNLEDYVHQNDLEERTVFFGNQPIDDVVKLLQKSKIFVFTSLKEALPTVLIEAMMTGNAIIAYDCNYGPSDIINENNGFLIPLHDKKMFIEKLEYLTHNPEVLNDLMKSSFEESKKWKKEKPIEQWKSLLNSN